MAKVTSIAIIILFLFSCTSLTSVVSVVGNAGISSKGIKTSLKDTYIKSKLLGKLSFLDLKNLTNISINVLHGTVLYTGYVENSEKRLLIIKETWKVDGVEKIINELKINNDVSLSQRTEDFIQKTKINSKLLFKSKVNSNNYGIDVVNGEVYVIGLAESLDEKNEVEKILSSMPDIKNLITIIEIPKTVKKWKKIIEHFFK